MSDKKGSAMLKVTRRVALASVCVVLAALVCRAAKGPAPVRVEDYKERIRVACVGDSITFGAGIKDRGKNSYPAQLGRLLGEKWEVRNFGVSSATLLKKGDKPYHKLKAYADALAYVPDVVIIKLGTNDSKPQNWQHKADFVADYKEMIAAFRKANAKVRVYVCLPVPAFPGRWGIDDGRIRNEVIPLTIKVVRESGATGIDLYTALSGKKELFPDTVHPNREGAALMAARICRVLTGNAAKAAA